MLRNTKFSELFFPKFCIKISNYSINRKTINVEDYNFGKKTNGSILKVFIHLTIIGLQPPNWI